jgi:hypothetical protein
VIKAVVVTFGFGLMEGAERQVAGSRDEKRNADRLPPESSATGRR